MLEFDIDKFMEFYRDSFPHATITPKLHMLEDHIVPFLQEFHVGLGFLGEQGAESIHARFNKFRQDYRVMPNRAAQLKSIMNAHLLQVCPDNLAKVPVVQKRPFKTPREPK